MVNIIHIRTSTEEQNPQNQLEQCKSIYKEEWGEVKVFEERQSAWKDTQRLVFEEVKELIKQGHVRHYVCWDIDRIYRNRKRIIAFFKFCKMYGCKIHSYRQQFFETLHTMPEPFNEAMFDFMLQMMGWFAEDESNKKSDRVRAAVRKEEGKPTKSYKGNRWGRKTLSSQKVNQVKVLYEQGKGLRAISRELGISVGSVHKYIPSNHIGKNFD